LSAERKKKTGTLDEFTGSEVVVDTATPIIYLGKLEDVDDFFLTLVNCDVHDVNEGASTKEVYCIEAKKHGIKMNRRKVKVRRDVVVSISLLEDIIEY